MAFFFFSLTLFSLSLPTKSATQEIKSARVLDLVIENYTFRSYETNSRAGEPHSINLPSSLSGISVDTVRLRCGSLKRHGAEIKEFVLSNGTNVHPCTHRLVLVRQNLGPKWSSIYYNNYELSISSINYQLISPILGLLAYSIVRGKNSTTSPTELEIRADKTPITIDFSRSPLVDTDSRTGPLCASFDRNNRKVILSNTTRAYVCAGSKQGHFGLVVDSTLMPLRGKVSKWKMVGVSSIGGALGASLLSLLLIAMCVNAKKKARMDEVERRAYEEEAFQVSMVGHVRSVCGANGTRTVPTIEHYEYRNSCP